MGAKELIEMLENTPVIGHCAFATRLTETDWLLEGLRVLIVVQTGTSVFHL